MEISQIIPHIEALVFASEKPLTSIDLVDLVNNALGFIEDRATLEQVETAVDGIREKYATEFYPFELRQSGGGWQFLTKARFHKTIAQLNGDKFLKRLSAAAMETLAIIAYKQPITKGEIESIRGVNCDYVIQKLLEKELVIITGRNEDMPGKPLVYATSKSFMDYFGMNSADDLPKIKEVLASQVVEPTLVNASHFEVEGESNLIVAENGELILTETAEPVAIEDVQDDNAEPGIPEENPDDTPGLTDIASENSGTDLPEETSEDAPADEEDAAEDDNNNPGKE